MSAVPKTAAPKTLRMRQIDRREWSLSWAAIAVTLLLTAGLTSFAMGILHPHSIEAERTDVTVAIRGLVALVFVFDLYVVYQQLQISRMRRRLVEREEFFQLISENVVDMIAVVDSNGKRIYNSPSYHRILGYSLDELEATSSFEQVHPDDRQIVVDAAADARRTGAGRRIEYRMRHKDGSWIFLESTASPVVNAKGEVETLVIVNRDISERRRLEEQLRQSQKMDAIGRLSGGVAHDFNNLLGVIIGYAEILQERIPESDSMRAPVDQIIKAGSRASSLTKQLLAFSRQQVMEPKVLLLNAVVSDTEKMLRRLIGEDIELLTSLDPALGKIRADQGQIEQVIMNLAVNARDAMPEGGRLVIETTNFEIDDNFARRYAYPVLPGSYIRLTVTDTGIGMDTATQQRIFEPFFTTKEKGKGTGLGLSTVYGVVKQSGGYIDVASARGKGTTFNIYLPRVAQNVVETKTIAPDHPEELRGTETILLAEDEDTLRALTRHLLELYGYRVLEACDGNQALRLSEQTADEIHLLLTDVVMPGISGRVLADQLKQKRPEVRVVFMSGYTGQRVGEKEILEPGSHFLQKPFTRDGLARKIREALDVSRAAPVV
ncbi:MAG TPA: PAS domain S-box protein [Candidatus Baltobacteraceae bacterium]|nr:PAS domain S-box protein [Candidatus Baltobacteraceae bacterium]